MAQQRIAVLGGTGRVGGLALEQALDRGLAVSTLVREPGRLPERVLQKAGSPGTDLRVVRGGLDDAGAMAATLADCDAAVVAVGVRYRGNNPWRGLDGPADVVLTAVASLRRGAHSGLHVVLLSAFGAGESWGDLPWIARAIISTSALKRSYAGLTRAEEDLRGSGLPHTVVRAVTLSDAGSTGASVDATGIALRGNPSVPRVDVARLLLDSAVGGAVPTGRRMLVAARTAP